MLAINKRALILVFVLILIGDIGAISLHQEEELIREAFDMNLPEDESFFWGRRGLQSSMSMPSSPNEPTPMLRPSPRPPMPTAMNLLPTNPAPTTPPTPPTPSMNPPTNPTADDLDPRCNGVCLLFGESCFVPGLGQPDCCCPGLECREVAPGVTQCGNPNLPPGCGEQCIPAGESCSGGRNCCCPGTSCTGFINPTCR